MSARIQLDIRFQFPPEKTAFQPSIAPNEIYSISIFDFHFFSLSIDFMPSSWLNPKLATGIKHNNTPFASIFSSHDSIGRTQVKEKLCRVSTGLLCLKCKWIIRDNIILSSVSSGEKKHLVDSNLIMDIWFRLWNLQEATCDWAQVQLSAQTVSKCINYVNIHPIPPAVAFIKMYQRQNKIKHLQYEMIDFFCGNTYNEQSKKVYSV